MDKLGRNDLCWCKSNKKYKNCHCQFDHQMEEYRRQGHVVPDRTLIKSKDQISQIRESAKINTAVLDFVQGHIEPGITTEIIDQWVWKETRKWNAVPAPLHYQGFPKSVCISVNEEVCHGIPSREAVLKEGDIVNVDVSTNYHGFYSDASRMFCIGNVTPEKRHLVETVKECVQIGLKQVKPWGHLGDMGQAVYEHAYKNGYSVVREIGGHGIGLEFHEEPWVSYVSRSGTEMLMAPGMIFTIEPMVNMGSDEIFVDEGNGWTVYTADGLPSAQWEIQVLVTEYGHEVLAY